ncbi:MAG: PAS domain S-box protein [Chloroflexota bacterium]
MASEPLRSETAGEGLAPADRQTEVWVSDAELRVALLGLMRASLRPVTAGLGVLYVVVAVGHLLLLDRENALVLASFALLTAVVLLGAHLVLRRRRLPAAWVYPLAAGTAGLVLANSLLHLYLTEQLEQTTGLILLLIGAAVLLLSPFWLGLIAVLSWGAWALVVWSAGLGEHVDRWAFGLLAATALAAIIHAVRIRTLRHLELLRIRDRRLAAALDHAQQAVQATEESVRQFAQVTTEGLIVHDRGTILEVNRALARQLGCEPGDLAGKSVLDLIAPEARAQARERLVWSGETAAELTLVRRDGTRFPADIHCQDWTYQGRAARLMAVPDISARKASERGLRRAQEYAELLYRAVPTAVFTVDRSGTITSLNGRAVELLGYSTDEIIGQPCTALMNEPCPVHCGLCAGGPLQPVSDVECTLRAKDGAVRTVVKNIEMLTDPTGQIIGGIESFVDVTEHRRVEHELRKLSSAVEQSPSVVMITDVDGTIEYVNPRFTAVTGYTASEAIGQRPSLLKSGHTTTAEYEELWETITAGGEWRGEFLNKKKSGELYWELATILPIRDSGGRITHFLGVKEDITARKRAEQALQESLFRTQILYNASHSLLATAQSVPELLQAVVDSVAAALYADCVMLVMLDRDARTILHCVRGGPGTTNNAEPTLDELWDGLSGWVLREGRPALSPKEEPDPRESPAAQQQRLESGCGDIIVVPMHFHDGNVGTLTATNLPGGRSFTHQDLELTMALANQSIIAIDNARLVDSLRQSEEKFSHAFRASPDAMIINTLDDGRFIDVNDSFLNIVGYERDEVMGRTISEIDIWPDPDKRDAFLTQVAAQGAAHNLEVAFRRKSGEIGVALLSAEVVELDGERCLLTIAKDITERIQAAQERELLIQELDAFARTVAHDLKGPLSPILGYADMLLSDSGTFSDEARRAFVQIIADSAKRMGNIIDELLLLARMRQGEVQARPLNMASIVDDALSRLDYMVKEYDAEVVVTDAWPPALGYGAWVAEVWVNYISNALKHGGRPPRIELGADVLPDGTSRFWVRDNGEGLSPEQQAQLFTPFTQLRAIHVEGHGLGLSIVRRIVEKLSGEAGVESAPGQGSLFYFTLPPVLPGDAQEQPDAHPEAV